MPNARLIFQLVFERLVTPTRPRTDGLRLRTILSGFTDVCITAVSAPGSMHACMPEESLIKEVRLIKQAGWARLCQWPVAVLYGSRWRLCDTITGRLTSRMCMGQSARSKESNERHNRIQTRLPSYGTQAQTHTIETHRSSRLQCS